MTGQAMCMPGSTADFFRTAARLYAVALIFNLVVGIHSWLPGHRWLLLLVPVPEALVFALLTGGGKRRLLPVSLAFPLFSALSAGEAFFRHVYRRPFDPVANLPLASRFAAMFMRRSDIPPGLFIPGVLFLYLLLSLLFRLILIPAAACSGRFPENRKFPAGLPAFLPLMFISVAFTPIPPSLRTAVAVLSDRFLPGEPIEQTAVSIEEVPEQSAPAADDPDLHLFIVESYGMTVFTDEHHRERILPLLEEREELLAKRGFRVVSSGYSSTTFGGTSWLADATILSGIKIDTQEKYDRLIASAGRNIIHLLKEKGYTAVLSAPGTSFMTDTYLGFYAYDHLFLHDDFGYEGPYFTFGTMPDQYHLHRVRRDLLSGLQGKDQPLFVEYILCSSHVPWNYIPPYIESWDGFDDGKVYFDRGRNSWYDNSWVSGSELFEGYDHSIRYTLETVTGFIAAYLDPEAIAVIIGDHQPKFPVSEKGADFSVPVHIVTGRETYIDGFLGLGYGRGVIPPRLEGLPSLDRFLPDVLKAVFGGSGEAGE